MPDVIEPTPSLRGDCPAAASPEVLLDRKALAATAFERTRMPMLVADARQPDHPIVLANRAFLELTGYEAEEVVGRNCRFLQGQATSPAAIAEMRAALREEREVEVELLNYRKDGSAFWNQLHLSPIHDDDGRLRYFFASQINVTEHRKVQGLEASEHRLLMEVDHRARNVLAVVNGIVRLSRADDVAVYAAQVQQRVQALARAHSLLADGGWRAAPLDQLIRQQVSPFGLQRIALEGPQVWAPATLVQPLALIVHELIVNAATHGALADPAGRLSIRWRAPSPDGRLQLHWQEVQVRAPTAAGPSGFGTIMVDRMIEKQLRGEIRRDWSANGLRVTIEIPDLRQEAETEIA